jgi:hypothetical protein
VGQQRRTFFTPCYPLFFWDPFHWPRMAVWQIFPRRVGSFRPFREVQPYSKGYPCTVAQGWPLLDSPQKASYPLSTPLKVALGPAQIAWYRAYRGHGIADRGLSPWYQPTLAVVGPPTVVVAWARGHGLGAWAWYHPWYQHVGGTIYHTCYMLHVVYGTSVSRWYQSTHRRSSMASPRLVLPLPMVPAWWRGQWCYQ